MNRWRVSGEAAAICLVPLSFPVEQLDLVALPVRAIHLAMAASVALVVAARIRARRPLAGWSPTLGGLSLLVGSALVSSLFGADPGVSARLDAAYLLGLGLAMATALAGQDGRSARAVLCCLCLVGVAVCAEGAVTASSLEPHYGGALVENRPTGIFGQPNELGAFAAMTAMLGAALFLSAPRRGLLRLVAAAAGLAGLCAVVVTLSRGAWVGLVLGLLVLGLLAPQARRMIVATIAVAASVVTAATLAWPAQPLLSVLVERAASIVDGQRNPYDNRPEIWHEAVRQIEAHPLLGVGPGGYAVLAERSPSAVALVAPEHAHSLLVTLAAEQGVIGVAALGFTVFAAVRAVTRSRRRRAGSAGRGGPHRIAADPDQGLLAGVAATLAVVLGQGLIDYPLRNAVLASLVWLLIGLLVAVCQGRDGRDGGEAAWPIRTPPLTVGHREPAIDHQHAAAR